MHYLLADSADSFVKVIFGAIVVVIWLVGGILSQLKKKADRDRWNAPQPQQDWSHLLRDLTGGQAKPWNPNTPIPPPIPQNPQLKPQANPQRPQQIASFAQQSPRPFVQQYPPRHAAPHYTNRPMPARRQAAKPIAAKPFQGVNPNAARRPLAPKPVQRKPKQQRRQPAAPAVAHSVMAPQVPSQGGIQNSVITSSSAGQTAGVHTGSSLTGRTAAVRLTSGQLRKLILWSEILDKPLALREASPE